MKSIKEKAEEHLRENNITQYEYKSYIEGAVFGANYVLDEIESIMADKDLDVEETCDQIYVTIKQLKK